MQQLKKIIAVGNSRGISLPAAWLAFHRKKYGRNLTEVLIDVQENVITISIVPGQERKP